MRSQRLITQCAIIKKKIKAHRKKVSLLKAISSKQKKTEMLFRNFKIIINYCRKLHIILHIICTTNTFIQDISCILISRVDDFVNFAMFRIYRIDKTAVRNNFVIYVLREIDTYPSAAVYEPARRKACPCDRIPYTSNSAFS